MRDLSESTKDTTQTAVAGAEADVIMTAVRIARRLGENHSDYQDPYLQQLLVVLGEDVRALENHTRAADSKIPSGSEQPVEKIPALHLLDAEGIDHFPPS